MATGLVKVATGARVGLGGAGNKSVAGPPPCCASNSVWLPVFESVPPVRLIGDQGDSSKTTTTRAAEKAMVVRNQPGKVNRGIWCQPAF